MQNVQEKVITPSNKKALGIGLILIMLAGFAASLQDFISQTVFLNSILSLATSAVFFVLVTVLVICWKKSRA